MKKLFSILLFAIVLCANISYPANELFRSISSGPWTNSATWEASTNGGANWITGFGVPDQNSGFCEIRGGHNITVLNNAFVTCNQLSIRSGATLTILSGGTVTVVDDGGYGDLTLENGANITGAGYIQTTGNDADMNIGGGSNFLSPLKVVSGNLRLYDAITFLYANIKGDITINTGTTLSVVEAYSGVKAFGNVMNNGTIIGGTTFFMKGSSFINNGTVSSNILYFDTTTTISGADGNWYSQYTTISSSGNVICGNDINITAAGLNSLTTIKGGGKLNLNGYNMTVIGSPAAVYFITESGSTIENSGTFHTKGNVYMDIQTGSNFNLPLIVNSGFNYNYCSTSPYMPVFKNSLTIDSNAVFTPQSSFSAKVFGTVINKGEINGYNFYMKGSNLINNGIIDPYIFNFDSATSLSGTGSFGTSYCYILNGANVTLASNHQFKNININAGGIFNITSKTLKLNGPYDPITNSGTFTTAASTIEYNGTFKQYFPQLNIDYVNVTFNNPDGFEMYNNGTASGLVRLLSGDVNLNTRIFTLQPAATLSETPGNTVFGDYGYLITTRNLNAPNSLNVGGLGASITTSVNLGSTIIKRGHSIQNLPNGLQSIQRYFEITPDNNSNLNATLIYKYDDSEINGLYEPGLSLFNSTNAGSSYSADASTLNIISNTLTETGISSFGKYTSGEGKTGYINLTVVTEGLYNPSTLKLSLKDTISVFLNNANSPYAIVDSAKATLDSVSLTSNLTFKNAASGNYYIVVKHRNSIETWSSTVQSYATGSTLNYNFTASQNKAFGNNMILKGTKWAFYSGDTNQDGAIDLSDLSEIDNDSFNFLSGYVQGDLNGDYTVDLSDAEIADNNANQFISKIIP